MRQTAWVPILAPQLTVTTDEPLGSSKSISSYVKMGMIAIVSTGGSQRGLTLPAYSAACSTPMGLQIQPRTQIGFIL